MTGGKERGDGATVDRGIDPDNLQHWLHGRDKSTDRGNPGPGLQQRHGLLNDGR